MDSRGPATWPRRHRVKEFRFTTLQLDPLTMCIAAGKVHERSELACRSNPAWHMLIDMMGGECHMLSFWCDDSLVMSTRVHGSRHSAARHETMALPYLGRTCQEGPSRVRLSTAVSSETGSATIPAPPSPPPWTSSQGLEDLRPDASHAGHRASTSSLSILGNV